MTTFPHRVIRMCIFQQLVYIHQIQDLLLTTKATTKTQSTCQLFLEINHVVSTSDQLMPSHSQLTKSTTTSYNISPPCFLVLKRVFKDSKAITAKVRSCTSNTTLLADDSQNCVSLEHLMITTSKSPNFSRCTRNRSIPETHSSIPQSNRNPSSYCLRIILKRFHKLQLSSEKLIYLSLSLSPSPPLIVG